MSLRNIVWLVVVMALAPVWSMSRVQAQAISIPSAPADVGFGSLVSTKGHFDVVSVIDGAMTNGSAVLTCATSTPFKATDVGKVIQVPGSGVGGVMGYGTIVTYTDSSHVTVSWSAGATVSAQTIYYGHDDSTAIQNAINAASAAGRGTVWLGGGTGKAFAEGLSLPANVCLLGAGPNITVLMAAPGTDEPVLSTAGFSSLTGVSLGGAVATASISGGAVTGFTVTQGSYGAGYAAAPTATVTTVATGATASAVESAGAVTTLTLGYRGSGYTAAPNLTFTGGGATTQATGHCVVAGGQVTSVVLDTPGSGYTGNPTVTISAGSGAAATATLTGTAVTGLSLGAGGANYTQAPIVVFSGGSIVTPTGVNHFAMRNITFDGNAAGQTGSALYTTSAVCLYGYDFRLENCVFRNANGDGLYTEWALNEPSPAGFDGMEAWMSNCRMHDNLLSGVDWTGPHDAIWENCIAFKNTLYGFLIDQTPYATGGAAVATACHSWGSTQAAAWYVKSGSTLDNCTADGSATVQVVFAGTGDGGWVGGHIINAQQSGAYGIQIGDDTASASGLYIQTEIEGTVGAYASAGGLYVYRDGGYNSLDVMNSQASGTAVTVGAVQGAISSSDRVRATLTQSAANQTGSFNQIFGAQFWDVGVNNPGFRISASNTTELYFKTSTSPMTWSYNNGQEVILYAGSFNNPTMELFGASGHVAYGTDGTHTVSVANGTQGTGATAGASGMTDSAGSIAVTTIVGAAAGTLVVVTFANAYASTPHAVTITPATVGATGCLLYVSALSATGFTVSIAATTPPASTAAGFYYHVDG